ncbi:MAG: hypothetical protein AAFN10_08145 [Bacteroidota bacterium]
MKVHIKQPVALHEAGNQSINEDFVYPLVSQVNKEERLFIVCDGEGGSNAGEVASKLVALNLAKYYASYPPKGEVDQDFLDNALQFVEQKLSNYKANHPESIAMSTGMAMLYFGETQVTMAWAGNCEISYYNAASKKLIPTHDGSDKKAKAAGITGSEKPSKINMRFLPNDEIGKGDFFFLSTSGIKEHVDEGTLTTLFESGNNPKNNPDKLLEEIRILNQGFAKDNYSCYLIQIEKVSEAVKVAAHTAAGAGAHATTESDMSPTAGNGMARTLTFTGVIAILACLVGLAAYWGKSANSFDDYYARANDAVIQSDYEGAIAAYDSALLVASTAEDRNRAMMARDDAYARYEELQTPQLGNEPLESLTESPEIYLDKAEAQLKEDNFADAAANFLRAERVIERDKLTHPTIPFDQMAYAFLMAGNEQYEGDGTDCAIAEVYYEKAFYLLQSPEVKPKDTDAFALAEKYRDSCATQPDVKVITSSDKSETSEANPEESSPANKTNTRQLAPAQKKPASTNTQPTSSTPKPAEIASASRVKEPGAVTRSASPSGINTRGMDPEVESGLNKYLSEGQRLYVRAKDESSNYLYKLSAENLLEAEAILDGPGSYMLAYMYHMGYGIPKDKAKALQYAQKSALKNWPAGHYLYAHLLLARQNPRDSLTAKASLERAASLNYPDAIFRLQQLNGQ